MASGWAFADQRSQTCTRFRNLNGPRTRWLCASFESTEIRSMIDRPIAKSTRGAPVISLTTLVIGAGPTIQGFGTPQVAAHNVHLPRQARRCRTALLRQAGTRPSGFFRIACYPGVIAITSH